ncbi:MAG: hypothetical protein RR846_00410 [Oscillospiraceae bacterium]
MENFIAPIIIVLALLGVFAFTVYRASKFSCRCTKCKTLFKANPVAVALAPQSQGKKHLMCPNCRSKQLCNLIFKG